VPDVPPHGTSRPWHPPPYGNKTFVVAHRIHHDSGGPKDGSAPPGAAGDLAVFGREDPAKKGCPCTVAPQSLSRCDEHLDVRTLKDVFAAAAALSGRVVHVRGLLGVGAVMTTLKSCMSYDLRNKRALGNSAPCCNASSGPVVLGEDMSMPWESRPPTLELQGFYCSGYDGEVCCNAPTYGESVVATGRLTIPPAADSPTLADATLCTDDADSSL
jgi:hypothetical protein